MAQPGPLRVLVVEDDAADQQFLREALAEAASSRWWSGCPGVEAISLDALDDACDVAFDGAFDAILLNLSLPDSPTVREAFSRMHSVAPATPLIILADRDDLTLAADLLREGAQDVLVKTSIDAIPLAVAIRHAVERQRFVNGLRQALEPTSAPVVLPPAPQPDDDILMSLVRVAAVTARDVEVETAMLTD